MVGIVSSSTSSSTPKPDPFVTICNVITKNKAATTDVLKNLNTVLATGGLSQKFPLTYKYLTNQANQQLLLGNQQTCINFFSGLQTQFQADLVNDNQTVADYKQALIQFIQNHFPKIAAALG
jgi:aspartate oxidase